MRENSYVRVCGHVRSFQGKRNVVAFNISPVHDMNQISAHILSTIYAHAVSNMVSWAKDWTNNFNTQAQCAKLRIFLGEHKRSEFQYFDKRISEKIEYLWHLK